MKQRRFQNEIAKKILLGVAMITVATGAAITFAAIPGLGTVTKEIFDWYESSDKSKRYRIRKNFQALRRERLISERALPNGSTALTLSEKGKQRVLQYNFQDLSLHHPQKWDKKWRFVIFDLPVRLKQERELFRSKLKLLGFYQVNRSVWVHAFACRNEIDFVIEYLRISPHVRLIEAETFDGSEEVEEVFGVG